MGKDIKQLNIDKNLAIVCTPIDDNKRKIINPSNKIKKLFKRPRVDQGELTFIQSILLALLIIVIMIIGYLYSKQYIVQVNSISNVNN
jgi:hypothetical protein|tara:strand:- start:133 stop:396 length:264 start_codon:yes stop_codon:yes gene_type:complete